MGFFDKLGKKLNKDITNLYNNKFAQQDLNIASEIREFYPRKKTPNDNNYKFFLTHPATAAYNSNLNWDSKNLFKEIETIINKNYKENLIW